MINYSVRRHRIPKYTRAFTIWWPWRDIPRIYIPKRRYTDIEWVDRTIAHERIHVLQWLTMGRWFFATKYLFSRNWRLKLEAPAFAESVLWWWKRGVFMRHRPTEVVTILSIYAEKLATKYHLKKITAECESAIAVYLPPPEDVIYFTHS